MALAYLLHNMNHPHNSSIKAFSSQAFIVDHGMRPESAREAIQVQHNLHTLGIPSTILNITLRREQKNESMARVFRYQKIITAARRLGIHQLFLGHHHDDQMETILMRFTKGESPDLRAFRGMPLRSPTPYMGTTLGGQPFVLRKPRYGLSVAPSAWMYSSSEDGTECLRPLLKFTKAQLVATCEHFGVPFVSDRTNFDPTYTLRNAVRYLRSHKKLPRALQDESLQRLHSGAIHQLDRTYEAAKHFAQKMQITHRYRESGMLNVSFREPQPDMDDDELHGACLAIARLCDLTSPINKDFLALELSPTTTRSILNLLSGAGVSDQESGKEPHLLVDKVDFRPISVGEKIISKGTQALQVSRQAMRRSEVIANIQPLTFDTVQPDGVCHSTWLCWDYRFFIRIRTPNLPAIKKANLIIRPYHPEDVAGVRKQLQESGEWTAFEERLELCAPGHVRYTMPVIVSNEQVVAFPTCDLKLDDHLPYQWQVAIPHHQRSVDFFWPEPGTESQSNIF